jgi:hypothetical protein
MYQRQNKVQVVRESAESFLERELAHLSGDAATVVFHSIFLQVVLPVCTAACVEVS